MKNNKQTKFALSLALGMSLLGATLASAPAMAESATPGLFQMSEIAAPMLVVEAKAGDAKCGAGSCGSKTTDKKGAVKAADKHCASKGKDKHCASKAKTTAKTATKPTAPKKAADAKCGAGSCGSKSK